MRTKFLAGILLLPIMGCGTDLHQAPSPTYTATCLVQEPVNGGGGDASKATSFTKLYYATGATQQQLSNSLQAQGVGTEANPCLELTITQLPLRRENRFGYGHSFATARSVAEPNFSIRFSQNSSSLSPQARSTLAEASRAIMQTGSSRVYLAVSSPEQDRSQRNLSERRAQAVVRALVENGVPRDMIVLSRDAAQPGATANPAGRTADTIDIFLY